MRATHTQTIYIYIYIYIYYDIDQDKMSEGKGCPNFRPLTGGFHQGQGGDIRNSCSGGE